MNKARSWLRSSAFLLALSVGCSGTASKSGGLMVVLSTDVSIPKDIDTIGLYITSAGKPIYSNTEPVQPGGLVRLPATLNIVASDDPRRTVRIRAVGFSKGRARVLRDVIVTVPPDHTAQLRVPLNFLSFGSAAGNSPVGLTSLEPRSEAPVTPQATFDAFTQITNKCSDGQTDVGGNCVALTIDPSKLEEYDPESIFGGAAAPTDEKAVPGECFPTASCFAQGEVLQVDEPTCSVALPAAGGNFNVALQTNGAGFATNQGALVVLDQDANATFGEVGTSRRTPGRLSLPAGVCKKMKVGIPAEERVLAVVGSSLCVPKSKKVPLCDVGSATNRPLAFADAGTTPDGGPKNEVFASNLDSPRGLTVVDGKVYIATKGVKILRLDGGSETTVYDFGGSALPIGLGGGLRGAVPYFSTGTTDRALMPPSDVSAGSPVVPNVSDASAVDSVTASAGASYFAVGKLTEGTIAFIDSARGTADPFAIPAENGTSRVSAVFADPNYGLLFVHSGSNALYRCATPPDSCRNNFTKTLNNPKGGGHVRALSALPDGRIVLAWVPDQADRTGVLYRSTVPNLAGTPAPIVENLDLVATASGYGGVKLVGNNVYFADNEGIKAVPFDGGTPRTLALKSKDGIADLAVSQGYLYWLEVGSQPKVGGGTEIRGVVMRRPLE